MSEQKFTELLKQK